MAQDLFDGLTLFSDIPPMSQASGLKRSVFMPPETVPVAAARLFKAGYHIEDISGLDTTEGILVNYHFNLYERCERIVLRVSVPHEDGKIPSIASVYDGAEWHERELSDFFGVIFDGNPNPTALLLPEDDKSMPLRKTPDARRSVTALIDAGDSVDQGPDGDK